MIKLIKQTTLRFCENDYVTLYLDGKQLSGVKIISESHFREDLTKDLLVDGIISVLVKIVEKPTAPVYIGMNCEGFGELQALNW